MSEMRLKCPRREQQSGVALILLTLMLMTVLLPMVSLAIDLTMLYTIKAKLQGAVDGAVLAAGRSITGAVSIPTQSTRLRNIAQAFINANLPQGYWGVSSAPTIETPDCTGTPVYPANCFVYQDSGTKKIWINVTASVNVPLLFARTVRDETTHQYRQTQTLRAQGQAMRRWVRLVLVLDRSGSMTPAMTSLINAVSNTDPSKPPLGFVTGFDESRDQMGLVVFGGSAIVAYPPRNPNLPNSGTGPDNSFKTGSPASILNEVTTANLQVGSNTGTAEALALAYKELTKNPQPTYLNAIVFFTDGMPNGITASFNGNPATPLYSGDTGSTGSPGVMKNAGCTNWNTPGNPIVGWIAQEGGYDNTKYQSDGINLTMQNSWHGSIIASPTQTQLYNDVIGYLQDAGYDQGHPPQNNVNGCTFANNNLKKDLNSFPIEDDYGNKTTTADYQNSYIYNTWPSAGPLVTTGTAVDNAYHIGLVSWNAAYNAAKRIRGDTNLKPTFFCLGYSGNGTGAAGLDRSLLKRIANANGGYQTWAQDPMGQYLSTDYDPTSTTGAYFEASTPGSIAAAFQMVQSQILRLSM
jgi:hypothetical protein